MNTIENVDINNLVCINDTTGRRKIIDTSKPLDFGRYKNLCVKREGRVLYKDDWINPKDGYVCKSTPLNKDEEEKIYHSKMECNKAQLEDDSVVYKKIYDIPPFHPIRDRYRVHPLVRKWSRINILLVTFISVIVIFLIWLIFFSKNKSFEPKGLNSYFKRYIVFLILIILFIGSFSYIFCPYYVCILEPDSAEFRKNLPLLIHRKFCNQLNYFGVNFPGCTDGVTICDLTNNIYPGCWIKNAK